MNTPAPILNPTHLAWINPSTGTITNNDGTKSTEPFDPAAHMKGIEVQFDGGTAIEADIGAAQTLDLTATTGPGAAVAAAFAALADGSHTVDIAILTDGGKVSDFTATQSFSVSKADVTPGVATGLTLS